MEEGEEGHLKFQSVEIRHKTFFIVNQVQRTSVMISVSGEIVSLSAFLGKFMTG